MGSMTNIPNMSNMTNQFFSPGEVPFSVNQRKSSDADNYRKKRRNDDENQLAISMDNVSSTLS